MSCALLKQNRRVSALFRWATLHSSAATFIYQGFSFQIHYFLKLLRVYRKNVCKLCKKCSGTLRIVKFTSRAEKHARNMRRVTYFLIRPVYLPFVRSRGWQQIERRAFRSVCFYKWDTNSFVTIIWVLYLEKSVSELTGEISN